MVLGLLETAAAFFVATVALMFRSSASARSSSYVEGPVGLHVAVGDQLRVVASSDPLRLGVLSSSGGAGGAVPAFGAGSEGADGRYGFGSAAQATCISSVVLAAQIATPRLIRSRTPVPPSGRPRKSNDSQPTSAQSTRHPLACVGARAPAPKHRRQFDSTGWA